MADERRIPSLAALRAFEAAARHLSFTEAARELNLTQSAVSHRISGLEELLGTTLFRRTNRVIGLTGRGADYLADVTAALDRLAGATARLRGAADAQSLLVGAPPNFAAHWLVPRLPAFRARHPEIAPSVVTLEGAAGPDGGSLDVAIHYGARAPRGRASDTAFAEAIVPVCAPSLAPAIRRAEDLLGQTLLHNSFHPREWALWFAAAGLTPEEPLPGLSFHTSDLVHRAALAGLGIAMGRRPQVDEYRAAGTLVSPIDLVVPTGSSYRAVFRRRAGKNRKIEIFRRWLLAEAEPIAAAP